MTNCGHIRPRISNSDQFSASATEKATYGFWRQLVAYTALHGIYWSRMTCCRQWWSTMVKNIKLIDLVHFKAEWRDLGLLYQVIAYTAVWDKFGQIRSKVAYNGPVFVTVWRYDSLVPSSYLHNLFWEVMLFSVVLNHILIKETRKRESGQKWSITKHYETLWRDIRNYGHTRHRISNTAQFSASAPEKATYGLWRHLVADTA